MTVSCEPTSSSLRDQARWLAVVQRDRRRDDEFVYAVNTTGVYCRPSCPARRPRPEHVRFYESFRAAEQAGYRACKRCLPAEPSAHERRAALVREACRALESEAAPSLAELAAASGLSRFHFLRTFKAVTGLTPKRYASAVKTKRARVELARAPSVTAAIYEAGFGSNGRFYEHMTERLGMRPSEYRHGGPAQTVHYVVTSCSLGSLLVAATERGVCAIELGDESEALTRALRERFPRADLIQGGEQLASLTAAVVAQVEAPETSSSDLPLDIRATAFQERVFDALRRIPPGETATYGELARAIGAPSAARAVGRACGSNRLAVVIPCHRAIQGDGRLAGYRWGVERKRALLEREAAHRKQGTSAGEASRASSAGPRVPGAEPKARARKRAR